MLKREHICAELAKTVRKNGCYPVALSAEDAYTDRNCNQPKMSEDLNHLNAVVGTRGASIYCSSSTSVKKTMSEMTVGTDCTGIGTPMYALKNLGVDFQYEFASEIDTNASNMIKGNFSPKHFYGNLCECNNELAPDCDVYVAGFPCQPFFVAGLHQGIDDVKGRGKTNDHITCTLRLRYREPSC